MTTTNQPDDYNESAIRRVQQQLAQESTGQYVDPGQAAPKSTGPEKPGSILGGRYKLLENIGEGGMGSVWVAEQQQPVKRRVAIKLVKAGMDSKQVLARFEAERQALAVMDHPNIAKVFDGGMTQQGRPYFVMEYVKGVPFTDYCDQARLSLKERLSLFVPVCQAVQHAHHKGIIHRDLKPSNILICLYDGHPVPKVIDFGLAKAMHQPLTDRSIYTGHGLMIGTPMYMSPEQAELNNLDIDTRTDVYSLGVVLYEILVGTTPLEQRELQTAAYDEVLRLIKEVEPPRPSIRLSASTSLPSIAAQRSIDPRELRRSLAGELDWIVMKTLEKERGRRYETATSLANDIQRYLNEEAVQACPPSRSYQLKKFVRKHKGTVVAASVVLGTLLIGIVGTSWQAYRATRAEREQARLKQEAIQSEQSAIEARDIATQERDQKEQQRKLAEAATVAEAQQRELADQQRDLAERQLCQGILRPIGYGDELTDGELRSFVDWSAIPDARLKLRVLEIALADPETAYRLARRSERSIQAAVGISPDRRDKTIEVLSAKQKDTHVDPRIRVAACWLAMELSSNDLPAFEESMRFLAGNPGAYGVDFELFVNLATKPISSRSTDQIARRCDALIAILEESKDYYALQKAGYGLAALAPRLSAEQVIRGGDALIAILENSTDYWVLDPAGQGLVALAPKLSAEQVTRGWDALITILENSTDERVLEAAGGGLEALAPKLSAEQVTRGWDALIAILEKSTGYSVLRAAGDGLVALAPKLSAEQATRGGDALIAILEKSTNDDVLRAAGKGLAALAPKLSNDQLTRGGDALIAILENSTDYRVLDAAGDGLEALAPKLVAEQVKRGGDTLIAILENSTDYRVLDAAGDGLEALAPKLVAEQVKRGGDTLIAILESSANPNALRTAVKALVALAPKLSTEQVTRGGDALIVVLEELTNKDTLSVAGNRLEMESDYYHRLSAIAAVGEALAALTPQLNTQQISRDADALITVLEESTHFGIVIAAGESFARLAPKLSVDQVTRGWDVYIGNLEKLTHGYARRGAGYGLAVLASNLSAEKRLDVANQLVISLHRSRWKMQIIASVVKLLDQTNADIISAQATTVLLDLATSSKYFEDYPEDSVQIYGLARSASNSLQNPESLAKLLSHPSCVDEFREFMLQRLEELLFHGGEPVFQVADESEEETLLDDAGGVGDAAGAADAGVALDGAGVKDATVEGDATFVERRATMGEQRATRPERRFHSLHDASAWIAQNWPDFDLEATHPVTYYPEAR